MSESDEVITEYGIIQNSSTEFGISSPEDSSISENLEEDYNYSYPQSDSDVSSDEDNDIKEDDIKEWALQHRISNIAICDILKILHKRHPHLPKDARTLMNTNRHSTSNIKVVQNGHFVYFGMKHVISQYVSENVVCHRIISLRFNIDGIPVFRSSNSSFWPILCEINHSLIFVVCLYFGTSKPPLDVFFNEFVLELNAML